MDLEWTVRTATPRGGVAVLDSNNRYRLGLLKAGSVAHRRGLLASRSSSRREIVEGCAGAAAVAQWSSAQFEVAPRRRCPR